MAHFYRLLKMSICVQVHLSIQKCIYCIENTCVPFNLILHLGIKLTLKEKKGTSIHNLQFTALHYFPPFLFFSQFTLLLSSYF